jgi:hypothetical protein
VARPLDGGRGREVAAARADYSAAGSAHAGTGAAEAEGNRLKN